MRVFDQFTLRGYLGACRAATDSSRISFAAPPACAKPHRIASHSCVSKFRVQGSGHRGDSGTYIHLQNRLAVHVRDARQRTVRIASTLTASSGLTYFDNAAVRLFKKLLNRRKKFGLLPPLNISFADAQVAATKA